MPHLDELRLPRCVAGPLSGGPLYLFFSCLLADTTEVPRVPDPGHFHVPRRVAGGSLCTTWRPPAILATSARDTVLRIPVTHRAHGDESGGLATCHSASRLTHTTRGSCSTRWGTWRWLGSAKSRPKSLPRAPTTPSAAPTDMRTSRCSGELLALCEGWDSGRRSRPAGGRWGQSAAPPRASRAQGGP